MEDYLYHKLMLFITLVDKLDEELTIAELSILCGLLNDEELQGYLREPGNVAEKYRQGFLNRYLNIKEVTCKTIKKC